MIFETAELEPPVLYKLLSSLVIPRPIAWITTLHANGAVNAAPYSFFNILSDKPPVVGFGAAGRSTGELKDTVSNIERTGEFVVNLVHVSTLESMARCSADLPPGQSELDESSLSTAASTSIATPRIAASPASLECRLRDMIVLSDRARIILGDVIAVHVKDELFSNQQRMHLDLAAYRPVGRLFASKYVTVNENVVELAPLPNQVAQ
ncbi:MAG: hypothetical protein JWP36_2632 [Paucimonas sp.]|nr:hypothetical protein [Paucimonas sp.]